MSFRWSPLGLPIAAHIPKELGAMQSFQLTNLMKRQQLSSAAAFINLHGLEKVHPDTWDPIDGGFFRLSGLQFPKSPNQQGNFQKATPLKVATFEKPYPSPPPPRLPLDNLAREPRIRSQCITLAAHPTPGVRGTLLRTCLGFSRAVQPG